MPYAARRWAFALAAFFFCAAAAAELPERLRERVRACAACHGADGNSRIPGVPSIAAQPRIFLENQLVLIREGMRAVEGMQEVLKGLSDRELIRMAEHFSALPARPAEGEPDPALFQRGGKIAAALRCASCHESDYRGRAQMPRLAGQREDYLHETMLAYRDRPAPGRDTMMSAVLYGVSDSDIRALAHFLVRMK